MNRNVFLPILILIVGAIGAAVLFASKDVVETRSPDFPPPLVRVSTVHPQQVQLIVSTQGTVAPRTESTLIAQVAGQIKTVSSAFANGGFFEKGDILLTIDPRDYEVAVSQARVQVAQAEFRISREQEEADIAYQEWEKLGKGQPSALVLRKPQIAEAEATLEAARGSLRRAKLNLDRTKIRGPYAGRLRSKNADIGQFVGLGTPIGRIYAVDYAEVRLPIANQELAYLDLDFGFRGETETLRGPTVKLRGDFGGQVNTWEGQIVQIEGEVDARSRMVILVARIDNPYGRSDDGHRPPLAVGMYVTAEVTGKMADQVYSVPRAALRANQKILVVTDNRLYFRSIEILRTDAENMIITSGLEPGDQICLSPLDMVVEGMRVRTHTEGPGDNTKGGAQ